MPTMPRPLAAFMLLSGLLLLAGTPLAQQRPFNIARPIDPRGIALPPIADSAGEARFSFIVYGDTRGQADGRAQQARHREVIDQMLRTIPVERAAGFPVRFVVQTGDAVNDGGFADQFNVSFTPLIERLIREGRVPYMFAVGNHDLGPLPMGSPDRNRRLRITEAAMSKLWPPEGNPLRLDGYPTFAFGFGRFYFILFDSNIAQDLPQLTWVRETLERLDRTRFTQVIAVFHHPPLTTGPHGGPVVERQAEAIRTLYLPLFRKHHVRMTLAGHDHLYDHFVEHYEDGEGTHRMDHIVTGGGGAPIYTYQGEQDLNLYARTALPQIVRTEHLVRPGATEAANPHHFVVIEVDGDRMWLQPIAAKGAKFQPYKDPKVSLDDRDEGPRARD